MYYPYFFLQKEKSPCINQGLIKVKLFPANELPTDSTPSIPFTKFIFFHPDFTVGPGITPDLHTARGLYRRSGISPCPEDLIYFYAGNIFTSHSYPNQFRLKNQVLFSILTN